MLFKKKIINLYLFITYINNSLKIITCIYIPLSYRLKLKKKKKYIYNEYY